MSFIRRQGVTDRQFFAATTFAIGKPVALEASAEEAGHARVHFDNNQTAGFRVHRKNCVRTTGFDADFTQYRPSMRYA